MSQLIKPLSITPAQFRRILANMNPPGDPNGIIPTPTQKAAMRREVRQRYGLEAAEEPQAAD